MGDAGVGEVEVEGEQPRGFAQPRQPVERVEDRGLHRRRTGIAHVAHRGREIGGADEQRVDALDGGDLVQRLERVEAFDLQDQAELVARRGGIILDGAEAGSAGQAGHASDAAGGVVHCGDGAAGLFGRADVRYHQRLRALIEVALDQGGVVVGDADRGRDLGVGGDGLQAGQDVGNLHHRMLGVDQHPVEAEIGQKLGPDRAAERVPDADLLAALGQRALEAVFRVFHVCQYLILESLRNSSAVVGGRPKNSR